MSIKMIPVECPNCHAQLNVEEGREYAYCSYCGTKVIIHDTNKYTWVNINKDEAAIERAKAEKDIEIEKIKNEEKTKRLSEITTVLICAIVFAGMILLAVVLSAYDRDSAARGEIKNPYQYRDLVGQSTEVVVQRLKKVGFDNIESQADNLSLTDRIKYSKYNSGDVTSVWADGSLIGSGSYYPKHVTIIVKYKE